MKFLDTCKNLAFYRGMQRKIQLCKEIIKKFEHLINDYKKNKLKALDNLR